MDGWTIGLIAIVVVGLAAIITGALVDRARNRRTREEMLAPPDRAIPRFSPDRPAPVYLSELQARRPSGDGPTRNMTAAARTTLEQQLRSPAAVRVPATLASAEFATDQSTGRAVLDTPLILLCADPVGSVRELLPIMERSVLGGRPLVVAAPSVADGVRKTAEVNVIQGKLQLIIVEAGEAARAMINELTRATPTTASDRQAGYFPADSLGTVPRWVSTRSESIIVTSVDPESIT